MLGGEIPHLKKTQFFSLSHQLLNVFSLRDYLHINLHLHDHVGCMCVIAFDEHALCALVALFAYFKLEEAAQKIHCH